MSVFYDHSFVFDDEEFINYLYGVGFHNWCLDQDEYNVIKQESLITKNNDETTLLYYFETKKFRKMFAEELIEFVYREEWISKMAQNAGMNLIDYLQMM